MQKAYENSGVALVIHSKSAVSRKNNVENLIKTINSIDTIENLEKIKIEAIEGSRYKEKSKEFQCFRTNYKNRLNQCYIFILERYKFLPFAYIMLFNSFSLKLFVNKSKSD